MPTLIHLLLGPVTLSCWPRPALRAIAEPLFPGRSPSTHSVAATSAAA